MASQTYQKFNAQILPSQGAFSRLKAHSDYVFLRRLEIFQDVCFRTTWISKTTWNFPRRLFQDDLKFFKTSVSGRLEFPRWLEIFQDVCFRTTWNFPRRLFQDDLNFQDDLKFSKTSVSGRLEIFQDVCFRKTWISKTSDVICTLNFWLPYWRDLNHR